MEGILARMPELEYVICQNEDHFQQILNQPNATTIG